MILVSILSFAFAAIIVLESLIRRSDFFSPERVYLFFHAIGLGISFLALDPAMTPFRPLTSLVYFGSAVTFVLGVWVAKLLVGRPASMGGADFSRYNWPVHFFFAFSLLLLFVAGMIIAYHGTGAFPLLADNKGRAIKEFFGYSFPSSVALSYGGVVALLFFISIFRPRTGSRLLNLSIWMTIGTLMFYSLALSRSGVMFFSFAALFFYHYAVRRLSLLKLLFFFLIFSLVVLVTGFQKTYTLEDQYGIKREKILALAFKIPYLYFANNYWNLDYALNTVNHRPQHPGTYGFLTVSGISDFIYVPGGLVGDEIRMTGGFDDQFNKSAVKVRGLNTVGYQWALYREFGTVGVFVGAFILGCLIGGLYALVVTKPTLLNVAIYSYLAYFIALSMFGYFPQAPIYVYGMLYVGVVMWLGRKMAPLAAFDASPAGYEAGPAGAGRVQKT